MFWSVGAAWGLATGLLVLRARHSLSAIAGAALGCAWLGVLVGSKWQFRLESMSLIDALSIAPGDLFSGGRRLDLGLLTGFALAGLWCLATRAPWRAVGDALAVAASIFIPIGRLGCLAFGCCMGATCHGWAAGFCPRYPPGSEAYLQQLRGELIPMSATASLPAHPLPVYFAIASLLTLSVLLWMLHQGAPPGSLLAAFWILRPAAKLALEPLRANPSPSPLMIGIPLAALATTLAVLAGLAMRRLALRRMRGAIAGLAVTAVLALGSTSVSRAADTPPSLSQEWLSALQEYARDPVHNRRALHRLRRERQENLPPVALLALADSRLRSGNRRAAARLFEQVLARGPGEPWAGWAELGLGWIALAEDDSVRARQRFERVAAGSAPSRGVASLAIGLIDLDDGMTEAAMERLDGLANDSEAPPSLRQAAALGVAYTWYWAGGYREAVDAFGRASLVVPGGRLWDDGRYGAAIARWHAGEREPALVELRALGRMPSPAAPDDGFATEALDLEPGAVIRAGLARYRRLPFRTPEDQVVSLLDRDGPALAREELRRRGEEVETPPPAIRRARRGRRHTVQATPARELEVAHAHPGGGLPALESRPWLIALVVVLGCAAAALLWRGHQARVTRRDASPGP